MAARKPALRAVTPDDAPPVPVTPKSVTQAARSGTPLELLEAMRARIAEAVEDPNTPARDLAALSRRLLEIAREIEAIKARARQEAEEDVASAEDEDFDAEAI